jgi:glycosyltransferase involved in cell wall biosynthesis
MKKVKFVYNGIVKNEAQTLPRLLDSIQDIVSDHVLVDTGSSDSTLDLLKERGIVPYVKEFVNFEVSRTHALDTAKEVCGPDTYILLMDADMILKVLDKDAFFTFFEHNSPDVVMFTQKTSNLAYVNVRAVKAGLPDTRYVGVTHEYLSHPSHAKVVTLPETIAFIDDRGDGGSRADKYTRDRRLLEGAEQTPRTLFYLAQTYREMGLNELAVSTYQKRIDAGGWIEEIVYSRYCLIRLYLYVYGNVDKAREQAELIRASGRMRPEPFYLLCTYLRDKSNIADAAKYLVCAQMSLYDTKTSLPLFFEVDVEDYLLPFEEFMLWYHIHPNYRVHVKDLAKYLMEHPRASNHIKDCVKTNFLKFYSENL